jgi:hypothetical protein
VPNSQIEELRKKYEDNNISYDEIGLLFSAIYTMDNIYQERLKNNRDYIEKLREDSFQVDKLKGIIELQQEIILKLIER